MMLGLAGGQDTREKGRAVRESEEGIHAQKRPRFVATTSELDQINVASQLKHEI